MRKLIILRRKSFVGCLGKLKVYIEDRVNGKTVINGVPCRFLGKLKNGKQETFEIDGEARKVFAIFDALSKNYCNDFFQLEEGEEDVFLSGVCNFNPANGNAFRFDNNNSREVQENRAKGNNRGIIILVVSAVIGFILGFVIVFAGMMM